MANPISSNKSYLTFYGVVWSILIGTHFAILWGFYGFETDIALADSLVFNSLYALIGLSLWYAVRYSGSSRTSYVTLLSAHVLAATIVITAWLGISQFVLKAIIEEPAYLEFLIESYPWRIATGIFFYLVFALIYNVMVSYQELKKKTQEEGRLKSLVKEVELSALKSQINPHFLFNSLNSISSLTLTDPEQAQEMIIKLSEYLRYSLHNQNEQQTTLKNELHNLGLYLDIEKIRFGDRMIFEKRCSEESLSAQLPAMILQPLLENAIKHGVYQTSEQIQIKLEATINEGLLRVSIGNNFDPEAPRKTGTGTGLKNVSQRLQLIYRMTGLITTVKQDNSFEVTLKIPQNHED